MNREIKFRAWTPHGRKMIDLKATTPLALHPDLDVDGLFIPLDDDYTIMQYTGLKDRNGKEIYEGDIIQCGHKRGSNGSEIVYAFEWSEEAMGWDLKQIGPFCLTGGVDINKVEIIGNIHENPDLLK